jgi:hypothetical protein
MGRNAKRRRSQQRCPTFDATGLAPVDPGPRASVAALVHDALATADHRRLVALAERIVAMPGWRAALDGTASALVAHAWNNGWQPRDLVRTFTRDRNATDRSWMVAAIATESRSYLGTAFVDPGWRAQLVEIGAHDGSAPTATSVVDWSGGDHVAAVLVMISRLRWLAALPSLPCLMPPPQAWTVPPAASAERPADAVVAKVRALLAKAESTDFPAEAESLTAKAQELITRHAIDRAVLAVGGDDEHPIARRVPIDEPYAGAKSHLLAVVARANGCRTVATDALGFVTVFGYRDDVDTVELLHSSLLVQATRAMAGLARDEPAGSRVRSRAYRRAFLFGFAAQIGRRLHEAAARETREAEARVGSTLLPVLASRQEQVVAEVSRVFPRLVSKRISVSDGAGWAAGSAAAMHADMGLHPDVAPHLSA